MSEKSKEKMGTLNGLEVLDKQLRGRVGELQKMKAEGRKVIGYFPSGYVPEELILASGAIPIALHWGGEHEPVEIAGSYLPRWFDVFCRAQIGYGVLKEGFYDLIDLYVVPVTENHTRALADVWQAYKFGQIFRLGVPHDKTEHALRYYAHRINSFKQTLEELTGIKITEERLRAAINLCNTERELLRKISAMRKSESPPITGREFVRLSHVSQLLDKSLTTKTLKLLLKELEQRQISDLRRPRILLTGSTLAYGDDKIVRMIEEAGGIVVVEVFEEGLKHYWTMVEPDGDPVQAIADAYYQRRITPPWFRPAKERRDFLLSLVSEFSVDGVVWYNLLYHESYYIEATLFERRLKEAKGLPMLTLESDYDMQEVNTLRTRIETFIEIIT